MSLKQTPEKERFLRKNINNITKEIFEDVSEIQIQWKIDADFKNYSGIFAHIFIDNTNISKENINYLDSLGLHENKQASEILKNDTNILEDEYDIIVELDESMFENFNGFYSIIFSRMSNNIRKINLLK